MEIIKRANRVIYKVSGETISIPSRMYPLESDSFKCFDADNTSEIVDEKIKDIFDSIKPEVGKCFTNAEILCVALNKAGYPAEQYVGWLFMGDELPVHHSVVVLDDHVLDLSISLKSEDFAKLDSVTAKCKTKDDARERIAEYMLQKEQLPNYQRCIFGVVDKMYHYIGAPGTREAGIRRNKELRQSYPQHPCFQDVKNGTTRGQEILLRKNEKDKKVNNKSIYKRNQDDNFV